MSKANSVEMSPRPTAIEICAGGGGQALGLEAAGFDHVAAVEIDSDACRTLRANRPDWNIIERDVRLFRAGGYEDVDLLAGGVPCPPFSIAGKQLGGDDERDLFPTALSLVRKIRPKAVMLENVRGLASAKFAAYREDILDQLEQLGYETSWRILNACDFGVPQLRPRFLLVAIRREYAAGFAWPTGGSSAQRTVAESIKDLMAAGHWPGAQAWTVKANAVAPTIVGGSKKHGGPDLGPTRARKQWAELGVNGIGIADLPPTAEFPIDGSPKLTLRMVARIQGFPDDWQLVGGKTAAYRQIGNAFPPPVAEAVGRAIRAAITPGAMMPQRRTARQPRQVGLLRALGR